MGRSETRLLVDGVGNTSVRTPVLVLYIPRIIYARLNRSFTRRHPAQRVSVPTLHPRVKAVVITYDTHFDQPPFFLLTGPQPLQLEVLLDINHCITGMPLNHRILPLLLSLGGSNGLM